MISKLIGLALLLCFGADAQQFKMKDGIIHAKISYQNLNRIKIKNDAIDSIAGIDSAFHLIHPIFYFHQEQNHNKSLQTFL